MKIDRAQLHCLSDDGDLPCFLLEVGNLKILLDFPLPLDHLKHFVPIPLAPSEYLENLPEKSWYVKEVDGVELFDAHPQFTTLDNGLFEIGSIDFVIISNAHSLIGLPFLFKLYPDLATGRRALCTEPTIQLGRILAEEILDTTEHLDSVGFIQEWQKVINPFSVLTKWHKFYTRSDLEVAIDQTRPVSFGEIVQLNEFVDVLVLSSGFSIGSCNWLFQFGKEPDHYKLCYLSRSSSLSTHPRPLCFDKLTECDVAIITQLTRHPSVDPNQTINGFCNLVLKLLEDNCNILVPCHSTGIIYDLFECLSVHLTNSGIKDVSLLFVSPVSDQSLAFSNIFCEYLSDAKAQRTLIPDYPFGHTEMIRINQLKAFKHIYPDIGEDPSKNTFGQAFKSSRQVIFAGHPSLRMGETVHFMDLYRESPESAVIFVEPDYCLEDRVNHALAPYKPMAMKHFVFPLDTSLNFNQANVLLKQKLRPNVVLACPQYVKAGLSNSGQVHPFARYESKELRFPTPLIPRYPLMLELTLPLADSIQLQATDNDVMVARFIAVCSADVLGRYRPSSQYGGLLPYVAAQLNADLVQRFARQQYPCVDPGQLSMSEIRNAMANLLEDGEQRTALDNVLELKDGDKLSLDAGSCTLNVECDNLERRKKIKEALKTVYRPLLS